MLEAGSARKPKTTIYSSFTPIFLLIVVYIKKYASNILGFALLGNAVNYDKNSQFHWRLEISPLNKL